MRNGVTLRSDGTPDGTLILLDGKPVDVRVIKFEWVAGDAPKVTLEVYVDAIDVAGIVDVTTAPIQIRRPDLHHSQGVDVAEVLAAAEKDLEKP